MEQTQYKYHLHHVYLYQTHSMGQDMSLIKNKWIQDISSRMLVHARCCTGPTHGWRHQFFQEQTNLTNPGKLNYESLVVVKHSQVSIMQTRGATFLYYKKQEKKLSIHGHGP